MPRTPDNEYVDWLNGLTLTGIRRRLVDLGCERALVKRLTSKQGNSKQQIYCGGDMSELNGLPTGDLTPSQSKSNKPGAHGATKFQATVPLHWLIPPAMTPAAAPKTKVIYYPQYPEVRLSGFIADCTDAPGFLMNPDKRGKEDGRVLILGLTSDGAMVPALVLPPEASAARAVLAATQPTTGGLLTWDLDTRESEEAPDHRAVLLDRLRDVFESGWIPCQRLFSDGHTEPYTKRNAAGYTIEAAFGVRPNGRAEPDFKGWELKGHTTKSTSGLGGPVTLLTPEPNGGMYTNGGTGLLSFMLAVGHRRSPEKSGADQPFGTRWDFTGAHRVGRIREEPTPTVMRLRGFTDSRTFDPEGAVELVGPGEHVVAAWSFAKLLDHWKKKHAATCFIPVTTDGPGEHLRLQDHVWLGEGTRFGLFLDALQEGTVYYDPGIKATLDLDSQVWKFKRRNQFRAAGKDLGCLYRSFERVDIS